MSAPPVGPGSASPEERQKRLVFDMVAVRALVEVGEILHGAGIAFAPVKGIVLGRWLYADVAQRPYVDVDLLVPREEFVRAAAAVDARGWRSFYRSNELGELGFTVGQVPVELHAEMGRPDLSRLTVAEVLERGTADRVTFPFEIQRIDDVDHFLLLVLNVVKDGFTYANPHQPDDLQRLLERLRPRWSELIARAAAAGLTTALHLTTDWMDRAHGSTAFAALRGRLPAPARTVFMAGARLHTAVDRRQTGRLRNVRGMLGLALATLVPDDSRLQRAGLLRVLRRGAARRLGREPG